jgi:glycosyltransferase involved in cell wall biosynthesis
MGGKERRLIRLASYLHEHTDWRVTICVLEPLIRIPMSASLAAGIEVVRPRRFRWDLRPAIDVYRIAQRTRPDIIHAWGILETILAIPVARAKQRPLLSSMIGDARDFRHRRWIERVLLRIGMYVSDAVTANSFAGLQSAGATAGTKYSVIRNGVDIPVLPSQEITDQFREANALRGTVVVMVAAFRPEKRYDVFIELARSMASIGQEMTFVAVGDGPLLQPMRERAAAANVENIRFIGASTTPEVAIACADICCLLSDREGLPNSVIEYMLQKKPVIVTGEGGTKELVVPGVNGFHERNEDLEALRDHLAYLRDNPERAAAIGETGFLSVTQNFSVERMGESFVALYRELATASPRS